MRPTAATSRWDCIVIGSGYGGCTCARTLAQRRKRVLVLEQGTHVPAQSVHSSTGSLLTRVARLRNYAPVAAGGGSAVNSGAYPSPSRADLRRAFGDASAVHAKGFAEHVLRTQGRFASRSQSVVSNVANMLADAFSLPVRRDTGAVCESNDDAVVQVGTLANASTGQREDLCLWMHAMPSPPTFWPQTRVVDLSPTADGGWAVHTTTMGVLHARQAFVAAGALGTPHLLLRAARQGLSERGVHASVGRHLRDHRFVSVSVPTRHDATDEDAFGSRFAPLSYVMSRTVEDDDGDEYREGEDREGGYRVHSQLLHHKDCTAGLTVAAHHAKRCLPCPFTRVVNLIPSALVCDGSLGTASCDRCCGGAGRCCNPVRCCGCSAMQIVVGGEAVIEGAVTLSPRGYRVAMPSLASGHRAALDAHARAIVDALTSSDPRLGRGSVATADDSEWHFVGTTSRSHASCRLLDARGRAYKGLFVADGSVAARPSTLNTGPLAAFAGYMAAHNALRE